MTSMQLLGYAWVVLGVIHVMSTAGSLMMTRQTAPSVVRTFMLIATSLLLAESILMMAAAFTFTTEQWQQLPVGYMMVGTAARAAAAAGMGIWCLFLMRVFGKDD